MTVACQFVRAPVTSLFAEPNRFCEVETELLLGERFDVEQVVDGWTRGRLHTDGYTGWVQSQALSESPEWEPTHRVRVPLSIATRQASIKSPVVAHLSLGSQVQLREQSGNADDSGQDGIAVLLPGQQQPAYLPRAHICPLTDVDSNWVTTAEAFTGLPYSWGGRSASGLDCSALVQLAMQMTGIAMPRNSSEQQRCGIEIPSAQSLQRGDLIFWRGHVGIMLDSTQMLHANAHHMQVASEPLAQATARIATAMSAGAVATGAGDIVARRRFRHNSGEQL